MLFGCVIEVVCKGGLGGMDWEIVVMVMVGC